MQGYNTSSSDVHYSSSSSSNPNQGGHYSFNGHSNGSSTNPYENYNYSTTGNGTGTGSTSTAMNTNNHPTTTTPSSSSSQSTSFAQRIKNFDYQNTIPNEFRVYTTHGALLSFTTILLLLYLISSEYSFNLTHTTREKVYVNTEHHSSSSSSKKNADLLEMEIDITFPEVPCALLSIDAYDPNNQRQSLHIDNKHRVWKHRIGKNGKMIGHKSKFELGMTLQNEDHIQTYAQEKGIKFHGQTSKEEGIEHEDESYYYDDHYLEETKSSGDIGNDDEGACGSCYGAGEPEECCNTCDDVKRAYQRRGWNFDPKMDIKQCHNAKNSNEQIDEGCNVHGVVALSTGGGNLHITPGHELENFGKTFAFKDLAELVKQAFETFNVTHTVKKLRFGKDYPGDIHQLDGAKRNADDVHGMYQYYFQVVPTEYRFLNGMSVNAVFFSSSVVIIGYYTPVQYQKLRKYL